MTERSPPTCAERFFFDNSGYLVLERLLAEEHVARLREALDRMVARRRSLQERNIPHTGTTQIQGASTRIFYILDDDPSFLELIDWPPIWPYVTGLLNERPHHHASDAIVECGGDDRVSGALVVSERVLQPAVPRATTAVPRVPVRPIRAEVGRRNVTPRIEIAR